MGLNRLSPTDTATPLVSVVINTLDRADSLERALSSLDQLRYPNFEVVLVRGPCVDHTDEVIARFARRIRIAHCAEANLAVSRNIAVSMAAGEFIAFLDDDAIPEPDWLDRLIEAFADPEVAAVGGFIRDQTGMKYQYRNVIANRFADVRHSAFVHMPRSPDEYPSPTGTNVAFRREILVAIGGFDEEYSYFLDETDINIRLHDEGWTIRLIPDAQVHHKYLENRIRDSRRRPRSRYAIARSKAYFSWTHGSKVKAEHEIRAYLWTYRAQQACYLHALFVLRRIGWDVACRLMDEVNRGVQDGTRDAIQRQFNRPHSPLATSGADGHFKRFRSTLPAKWRMRICFLREQDYGADADAATRQMDGAVQALAGRGHEVSVICVSSIRTSCIDFVDGFWLHRIAASRLSRLLWRGSRNKLLRLGVAGAREIARVLARRQFQVVVLPSAGQVLGPVLSHLGLPLVAVRFGLQRDSHVGTYAAASNSMHHGVRVIALGSGDAPGTVMSVLEFQLARACDPDGFAGLDMDQQFRAPADAG